MEKVLQVGLAILKELLQKAAGAVWDDLWTVLILEAAEAEEKWKAGIVKDKKATVVAKVLDWLSTKVQIKTIQRWIISLVLGYMVDALIAELNDILGHNWAERVAEVKNDATDLVPWLRHK